MSIFAKSSVSGFLLKAVKYWALFTSMFRRGGCTPLHPGVSRSIYAIKLKLRSVVVLDKKRRFFFYNNHSTLNSTSKPLLVLFSHTALGIRLALIKYHIKPLGMTKTQGFCQDLLRVWFLFIPVKITWALRQSDIEPKGILKNPTDFYWNYHENQIKSC